MNQQPEGMKLLPYQLEAVQMMYFQQNYQGLWCRQGGATTTLIHAIKDADKKKIMFRFPDYEGSLTFYWGSWIHYQPTLAKYFKKILTLYDIEHNITFKITKKWFEESWKLGGTGQPREFVPGHFIEVKYDYTISFEDKIIYISDKPNLEVNVMVSDDPRGYGHLHNFKNKRIWTIGNGGVFHLAGGTPHVVTWNDTDLISRETIRNEMKKEWFQSEYECVFEMSEEE